MKRLLAIALMTATLAWASGPPGPVAILTTHPLTVPLNPCVVDAWPMNEGAGETLFDHGPAANNLVGTSIVWTTQVGFPGPVISATNTATAGSTTSTSSLFTGNQPFTVTFWSGATGQANAQQFFDTTNSLASAGLYIRIGGSGDHKYEVVLESAGYPTGAAFAQSTFTATGTLVYYAIVYNGTSPAGSNLIMYVNGSSVSYSLLNNALSSTVTSTIPLTVEAPIGALGFVETYNCALSQPTLAGYSALGPGLY